MKRCISLAHGISLFHPSPFLQRMFLSVVKLLGLAQGFPVERLFGTSLCPRHAPVCPCSLPHGSCHVTLCARCLLVLRLVPNGQGQYVLLFCMLAPGLVSGTRQMLSDSLKNEYTDTFTGEI